MLAARIKPRYLGALLGVGLICLFYIVDSILIAGGGSGLGLFWIALLVLPGLLAAWVSRRRGRPNVAEREGALAGLTTAHFAAALTVIALIEGVLDIDWTQYSAQAGVQVASAVKAAIVPAAVITGLVSVALIYAFCTLAGWLGAVIITNYESPLRPFVIRNS